MLNNYIKLGNRAKKREIVLLLILYETEIPYDTTQELNQTHLDLREYGFIERTEHEMIQLTSEGRKFIENVKARTPEGHSYADYA